VNGTGKSADGSIDAGAFGWLRVTSLHDVKFPTIANAVNYYGLKSFGVFLLFLCITHNFEPQVDQKSNEIALRKYGTS
jgi:hypothetical protein